MSLQNSAPCLPAANAAAKPRKIWTSAEDATLKALVSHYGAARGPHWKDVAAALPDRSAKDCRKRWFHSLDPSLRKGRWTAQEDQVLLSAYARLGPAWHDIGRKDDQCSKRYNDILDPQARNRLSYWSPREDEILREGVQTLGHRWSAISAKLPGRPPLTCRNRWRALSRPVKESTASGTPSSAAGPMSGSETAISPDAGDVISPAAGLEAEVAGGMDLDGLTSTMMDANAGFGDDEISFVTGPAIAGPSHMPEQINVDGVSMTDAANPPLQQSFEGYSSDSSDCAPPAQRSTWGHVPESSHSSLSARHPANRNSARPSRNRKPTQSAASSMGTAGYNIVAGSSSSRNEAETDPTSAQFLEFFNEDFAPDLPADLFRYPGGSTSASQQQQVVHHHHHYHHHYHHHHHHHHHQQQQDTNALRHLEQQAEAMSMRSQPQDPKGKGSASFPP
ncbi:transcription factor [Colletotrichum sojae]|uniref:Transcription factor n=1 Tax=Colletotrichum sojae TaxID=2175907 RepID=A0A8H6J802_9PEZI|nr:transcription factor [Colletotrichum sojae]